MSEDKVKPRRRIVLVCKIEADSWNDLRRHLHSLQAEIGVEGCLSARSVSGGYSSGHILVSDENGDVTHDSWAAELDAYLKRETLNASTAKADAQ